MVAVEKMPGWTRALEIVLGIASLIAGIWVLIYPGIAVLTLILLLSLGLIFLGWRDVALGIMSKILPTWLRAANIVLGILAFVLSVLVIVSPGLGQLTLILILYIALFVRGVAGISMGAAAKMFSTPLRAASIAVGVLAIILAIIDLAIPSIGIATLIFLFSFGLVFTGIEAIAVGIIGREIVPLISAISRK